MGGFKRRLFYLGGFDPRGARFYHDMCVEQMRRHAGKSGETIVVSPRAPHSMIRQDWTVANLSADVHTDYSFLRWEDLVQKGWIRNPLRLILRAIGAYARIIRHGDFAVGWPLGGGPIIALFYPPLAAIVLPILIFVATLLLARLVTPMWMALPMAIAVGVTVALPVLRVMHAPWLLRFFIFNDELSTGRYDPELDTRLDAFAEEIADGTAGYDEVLLVSHSNGAILAVLLMARLMARWNGRAPANFRLVTLGHCIPLVACRKDARGFLAPHSTGFAKPEFDWIDIGSPPDGAAYFGVNPLLIYGEAGLPKMELLSPRFHRFYDPETYHRGWFNKYEIHFDYLRSGDRVSPLDLPSLISSPRRIEESIVTFKALA